MLNPVQHDKPRKLQVAERLLVDSIRSLQDDKRGGGLVAVSLPVPPIRFLAALEMTR
jgi:hypothetical protein